MQKSRLLPRQLAFIQRYMQGMHAHMAAVKAGYTAATALSQASRLLATPAIKSTILNSLKGHQRIHQNIYEVIMMFNETLDSVPPEKLRLVVTRQMKRFHQVLLFQLPPDGPLPLQLTRLDVSSPPRMPIQSTILTNLSHTKPLIHQNEPPNHL